jgi:hypothetical protein
VKGFCAVNKCANMSAEQDVKLQSFGNIFSLDGKVAVVTGSSRGLGLHIASGYVAEAIR